MSEDILGKAEAFIRRRREQLGGVDEPPTAQWPDDIPVLTEVVDEGQPANDGAYFDQADVARRIRDALQADIARELDVWLDENLPQVVVHLLDGISDTLIRQVHESARADLLPRLEQALRDRARPTDD